MTVSPNSLSGAPISKEKKQKTEGIQKSNTLQKDKRKTEKSSDIKQVQQPQLSAQDNYKPTGNNEREKNYQLLSQNTEPAEVQQIEGHFAFVNNGIRVQYSLDPAEKTALYQRTEKENQQLCIDSIIKKVITIGFNAYKNNINKFKIVMQAHQVLFPNGVFSNIYDQLAYIDAESVNGPIKNRILRAIEEYKNKMDKFFTAVFLASYEDVANHIDFVISVFNTIIAFVARIREESLKEHSLTYSVLVKNILNLRIYCPLSPMSEIMYKKIGIDFLLFVAIVIGSATHQGPKQLLSLNFEYGLFVMALRIVILRARYKINILKEIPKGCFESLCSCCGCCFTKKKQITLSLLVNHIEISCDNILKTIAGNKVKNFEAIAETLKFNDIEVSSHLSIIKFFGGVAALSIVKPEHKKIAIDVIGEVFERIVKYKSPFSNIETNKEALEVTFYNVKVALYDKIYTVSQLFNLTRQDIVTKIMKHNEYMPVGKTASLIDFCLMGSSLTLFKELLGIPSDYIFNGDTNFPDDMYLSPIFPTLELTQEEKDHIMSKYAPEVNLPLQKMIKTK